LFGSVINSDLPTQEGSITLNPGDLFRNPVPADSHLSLKIDTKRLIDSIQIKISKQRQTLLYRSQVTHETVGKILKKRKAREAILDAENAVTSICKDEEESGKASASKKTKTK
jgi:hypothetical protein